MSEDPELVALSAVCAALSELTNDSQQRVVDYVTKKFGLTETTTSSAPLSHASDSFSSSASDTSSHANASDTLDDTDGISPVAVKWMQRNGFNVDQLGHLFSLGTEEIDLVSKSVPGNSMSTRTRSIVILKGIAAYLSSGVARITAEQIKEACLHYDAFDSPNHAKYLRKMSTEVTGNKTSGYTLTARGITVGSELIREMLGSDSKSS